MAAPSNLIQSHIDAQKHGFKGTPNYATAMQEMKEGKKKSHWIWYVWPILKGIRSTNMPWFEFNDWFEAESYMQNDFLSQNLVEITRTATEHLSKGVAPSVLFGEQAVFDWLKFHSCVTCFAILARKNKDVTIERTCLDALKAAKAKMHPVTVKLAVNAADKGVCDAVQALISEGF